MDTTIMLPDYRVRQRNLLLEIARALTERLELVQVLRRILEASASMLGGEVGLIALRDSDEFLRIAAAFGVDAEHLPVFDDLLEDIQAGDFSAERLNLRTRQIARRLGLPLRQVIALPMLMSEEGLGLVLVFRTFTGNASPDDIQVLQSFADQAAIAVHNARLYETVANEKLRLSTLLDNSADGIMILDGERRIQRFNHAIGRMTGWRPEIALGRQDSDVIRWKNRKPGPDLSDMLSPEWPKGQSLYVEGDLERLDGFAVSIGITYAVLRKEDGQPVNIIANVRDITHFRKAEEMKNTFISVISHELKTPVALIKGYAGTMLREDAQWSDAAYRNAFQVIEEEADRLTGLIENLLAASKLQAEGMKLSLGEVRLDALARRAAERFQTGAARHHLMLDFPPDYPMITGDETRLRQVVDNLISNAIKYSPEGGEIRIGGEYDAENVTFYVKDQGIGMREDELERIFGRFYRVDDALSRSTQGTGLGLFLARAVIEAHQGHIWAESQYGQGSTFFLTLPRHD